MNTLQEKASAKWLSMSEIEQRMWIATFMGWKKVRSSSGFYGVVPPGVYLDHANSREVPDYLTDWNEWRGVEERIAKRPLLLQNYVGFLTEEVDVPMDPKRKVAPYVSTSLIVATIPERALAFYIVFRSPK